MKFIYFLLLFIPYSYALDGQFSTAYQSYIVDSNSEGGDLILQYGEKLNYNAQATIRTRYGQTEYLVGLEKTHELDQGFYLKYGGAISFETSSFEKFSLSTGIDYYKLPPFNFFANLTYKKYSNLNFILLNPGLGWESKIGLLFIPQFYLGRVEDNSSNIQSTFSYALKVIYVNSKIRPFISLSAGNEADVLLQGEGLTVYKVKSYAAGLELPLNDSLALIFSFNRIELEDFNRKIDFTQFSFARNW